MKILSHGASPNIGAKLLPEKEFALFKSVLQEISEAGPTPQIIEIKEKDLAEWSLQTSSGLELMMSLHFKPENMAYTVKEIINSIPIGELNVLDFRVKNKVYYR